MGMQVLNVQSVNYSWEIDSDDDDYEKLYRYDQDILILVGDSLVTQLEALGASAVEMDPMFGRRVEFTAENDDEAGRIVGCLYNLLCEAREWDEAGRPRDFTPTPVDDGEDT